MDVAWLRARFKRVICCPLFEQSLSTPFQGIPERVGLAATTWAIFAESSFNPLGQDFGLRITRLKFAGAHLHLTFTTYAKLSDSGSTTSRTMFGHLCHRDRRVGTEVDVDLGAVLPKRLTPPGSTSSLTKENE